MQTHDLIQGSLEWNVHRATHFNASDAPAMLGVSPYKTRTQLLHEMATGIAPEIDAMTQKRFDDGHRFEALARTLAEEIVGEDLYPVTASEGKLSASFDGLTIAEDITWEHKTLNDAIRAAATAADLPIYLQVQMEQQLMISDAGKCLFLASKWDDQGNLIEEKHFWYTSNQDIRTSIVQGWTQFSIDLAAYVPVEVVAPAIAAPTLNLPAVSVQVQGAIALISNLDVFGDALKGFISKIPEKPSTDQEFADCKSAIGKLQDAQDALDAAEANALGQIATFDEMRRTKALYFDLARTTRLALEKLVTKREAEIKLEIMQGGKDKLAEHIEALNKRLGKPYMPAIVADFAAAIKSKRTIESLKNAVDTLLSQKKIEASAIADKIDANLKSLRELAADYPFLFADAGSIVLKSNEDLVNLINSRINEHKTAELAKAEAMRVKIAEEERIKAEAKAKADADAKLREEEAATKLQARLAESQQREDARQADLVGAVLQQRSEADERASVPNPGAPPAAFPFPTHAAPSTPPTLTLGKISARLGFAVTADFLRSIGFEPADRKQSSVLFHEADFPKICNALIEHIQNVCVPQAA